MSKASMILMAALLAGGGYNGPTSQCRYKEAKAKNPNKAKNKAERQRKKRGRG
jgi:hypothetical protein